MILVFFSSLELLHFDFLSGDGEQQLENKIYVNLSSLFYQ